MNLKAADVYADRNFDNWVKTETQRNIREFSERVGPTRIFDTSANALEYFQLFYDDGVFMTIVNYTNLNANRIDGSVLRNQITKVCGQMSPYPR